MSRSVNFATPIRHIEAVRDRLLEKQDQLRPDASAEGTPSMLELLADKVGDVNDMQQRADGMVHELLTGGDVNSAEVLTAVQKADMAFRTMLQVRNKLIEAYREILQIQV
jgi:flagellar hook-basal body complex protein FliE